MNPRDLLVGLTYNLRGSGLPGSSNPADEEAEFDPPEIITAIDAALVKLGCRTVRIGNLHQLVQYLNAKKTVDIVFNIAEGTGGRNRESQVPALLEAYHIPYTFSDPLTLGMCLDKVVTKHIWKAVGLPTPDFVTAGGPGELDGLLPLPFPYPVFVKPIHEGTSKGIDNLSLAPSEPALRARVAHIVHGYHQPALIEPYLPGREYTVGILGSGQRARAIGAIEVTLKPQHPVYGFDQKEACETEVEYTWVTEPAVLDLILPLALRAYQVLNCRDAGRVDLRMDAGGGPQLLEINPLPGLDPDYSSLPIIARHAGLNFEHLIAGIMQSALERFARS